MNRQDLGRSDQKELLRRMVARVVINDKESIRLELRAPSSYLQDIRDAIRNGQAAEENYEGTKKETSEAILTGLQRAEGSLTTPYCGTNWNTVERIFSEEAAEFFKQISFPQREQLTRLITMIA